MIWTEVRLLALDERIAAARCQIRRVMGRCGSPARICLRVVAWSPSLRVPVAWLFGVLPCAAIACGGGTLGHGTDGGQSDRPVPEAGRGADGEATAPPSIISDASADGSDANTASCIMEGGSGGGGGFGNSTGACTVSWREMCAGATYDVSCTCPDATCTCQGSSMQARSAPFGSCPLCPAAAEA